MARFLRQSLRRTADAATRAAAALAFRVHVFGEVLAWGGAGP